MEQLILKTNSRDSKGKGVRFLRQQGITPLHLFGNGVESLALQSDTITIEKLLNTAGETRLISLSVDKERKPRQVLVREIQRDPISGKLIHVDLYQVKMDKKVESEVPIILVGKAPALNEKSNMMLQELDSLSVESLPDKIPANLKIDVSSLTEAGQVKRVKDIIVDPDVVITSHADTVVVSIVARHEEKAPEKPAAEIETSAETGPAKEPKAES
jgi:large subunit ribosomal protein L25